MYTHIHSPWAQTCAHARPLVHIDTGCSECGSLGLALSQACGNSPEASSAVRPLPCAQKQRLPTTATLLFHNLQPPLALEMYWKILTFANTRRQPPCFAYLNVASRWWGPGGLRVGEKNRRPTSYYDVQSCAIETVGRTICTVAATRRG